MPLWLRGLIGTLVPAALLAGLAAWLALDDRSSGGAPAQAGDRVVAVGDTSLTVPAAWAPARAADAGVPALDGSAAVLAPAPGLRAYAVTTSTRGPLPAALEELLGPLVQGRRTMLAGTSATVYGPRPVAVGRTAELTVARTAGGVLAVACIARTDSWAAAAGCAGEIGRSDDSPAD